MSNEIKATTENQNKFQTGKVSVVALSHFIHDVYPAFLSPLIPLLIEKHEFSLTLAGILVLFLRMPSILSIFIGGLADKFSLRYFVILTPGITAVCMSLIPIASDFTMIAILLLITGLSSALYHNPTPVMIRRVAGNKVGMGMSFYMVAGELARTVGPMVILIAVDIWGLDGSYRVISFGILATIFLYFFLRKDSIKDEYSKKKSAFGITKTWKRLKAFYLVIAYIILSKSLLVVSLTNFLPVYLTGKGTDIFWAGAALSVFQLSGAVGSFLSGTLSDKFGRRNILLTVFLLAPVVMVAFALTEGTLMIASLVVLGVLNFSVNPVILALVQDRESEYPASANSIFMTLNFVIGSAIAFLVGFLGDAISLQNTFLICAGIAITGLPFVLKLDKDANVTR